MNKPYSNRALPSGTVLREWRLEEVLGVGGFGIVYKGRGIYFDELVAIKEYFPGAISERDADATVVPIDSNAEEVHALGLKKFVEEAKLLWNLSTPTRHPNIVNVRSLFEIHGTAYMVMDFEDGTSLSRLLKDGQRFNERSLRAMVEPIAEGLERAHRVGVLHRDIKPPNILMNSDGRPVLIDFGSARFETADATSTSVTFHTPPYAAIEQYVKTYPQGPWTDIYALGVVLYECITGEKPPEVLERLHGGLGKPLASEKWPGYGKNFLAAVDAAMAIRPADRPQSISDWLGLVRGKAGKPARRVPVEVEVDGEATRIATFGSAADEIRPVAPLPESALVREKIETAVPGDVGAVEFKRAGEETGARAKAAALPIEAAAQASKRRKALTAATPAPADTADKATGKLAAEEPLAPSKSVPAARPAVETRKLSPLLLGAVALALFSAGLAAWTMLGRGSSEPQAAIATQPTGSGVAAASGTAPASDPRALPQAVMALANDARTAGVTGAPVDRLQAASDRLGAMLNQGGAPDTAAMTKLALSANADFAAALLSDADSKAHSIASEVGWANPDRPSVALTPDRRAAAATLRQTLAGLRTAVQATTSAADPSASFTAARQALEQSKSFATSASAVYSLEAVRIQQAATEKAERLAQTAAPVPAPLATTPRAPALAANPRARPGVAGFNPYASTTPTVSTQSVSPAKLSEFNAIIEQARGQARQVMAMADRGSNPLLQNNKRSAANYDKYLRTLKDSMRGVRSDSDANRLIAQAKQTRAYIVYLVNSSNAAAR
ncbi:serine/threonine protein kinase [Sphingomonas ginkgonis]|uniref:Serine/threonine protein kinase n=1 Tax=Sphingomonas ginkgonis TaxID=2315330 RepID=A0A429VCN6_9SPHN|nr:serine/threonine-protein kinase [Sphingomonas ginkgonis]RST31728.1 serine/threonine protein kinase [Sphingomonas ginkgonis]